MIKKVITAVALVAASAAASAATVTGGILHLDDGGFVNLNAPQNSSVAINVACDSALPIPNGNSGHLNSFCVSALNELAFLRTESFSGLTPEQTARRAQLKVDVTGAVNQNSSYLRGYVADQVAAIPVLEQAIAAFEATAATQDLANTFASITGDFQVLIDTRPAGAPVWGRADWQEWNAARASVVSNARTVYADFGRTHVPGYNVVAEAQIAGVIAEGYQVQVDQAFAGLPGYAVNFGEASARQSLAAFQAVEARFGQYL